MVNSNTCDDFIFTLADLIDKHHYDHRFDCNSGAVNCGDASIVGVTIYFREALKSKFKNMLSIRLN